MLPYCVNNTKQETTTYYSNTKRRMQLGYFCFQDKPYLCTLVPLPRKQSDPRSKLQGQLRASVSDDLSPDVSLSKAFRMLIGPYHKLSI